LKNHRHIPNLLKLPHTLYVFLTRYVFDFDMNVVLNYILFFCVMQSMFPVKEVPVK